MRVTVKGRVNVDGTWWEMSASTDVDDAWARAKKINYVKAFARALSEEGVISTTPASQLPAQGQPTRSAGGPSDYPMPQQQATDLTPHCPDHREAMSVSTVQNKAGQKSYFCPKRNDDGYCRHRASVEPSSGIPTFWEVKK